MYYSLTYLAQVLHFSCLACQAKSFAMPMMCCLVKLSFRHSFFFFIYLASETYVCMECLSTQLFQHDATSAHSSFFSKQELLYNSIPFCTLLPVWIVLTKWWSKVSLLICLFIRQIPSLHQSEDYSAWALGRIQNYTEMIQLEIIHKSFKQGTYRSQISE